MPEHREQPSWHRRDVLVASCCLGGAALGGFASILNVPHTLPKGGLDALIPYRFGNWAMSSRDGVVVSDEADSLKGPYDDLLARVYEAEGVPPVALLIAYGGSQIEVQIHRPEICYPSAGYALGDREVLPLSLKGRGPFPATILSARSQLRSEEILYWTRIGTFFPTTGAQQRWAIFRENLTGRVPDGILFRLSTPARGHVQAMQAFEPFLKALFKASSVFTENLLLGTRSGKS